MQFITNNELETKALGEKLGRLLKPGDCICLDGDLGVGKTHFTKGLALGMGIEEEITSPTFTIVQEYNGKTRLYHFDVYRLFDEEDLYGIGFEDHLRGDGVIVIEWSDKVKRALPIDRLEIRIEYMSKAEKRKIVMSPLGTASRELIEKMQEGQSI